MEASKVTSNPGDLRGESPDGLDDTPAVGTHHGALPVVAAVRVTLVSGMGG
jgi:hypothetical protein